MSKGVPYQTTNQKDVEVKILPPPQCEVQPASSGVVILEHIDSNASNPDDQKDKSTTPPISPINQDAPLNTETPLPPPTSNGVVQNKGSSTMVPQSKVGDAQVKQETSTPSEYDLPAFGKAQFPVDYAEEEEKYSNGFETYFREDEDMEEVEPQPEDAHPTHPDTTEEPSTQARSIPHPILTPTLTEEEKIALKKSDPLKYVDLMMALMDSSLDKSASGTSTQSGASASEASYDELLQQEQTAEFDKARSASKASKDLLASRKAAQAEFDTYTASITLWESYIMELQKKITNAMEKQTAIKGLDTTEADTLAAQSVEHVERASAMTEYSVRLKSIHAVVQYKLGLAKIKYERMKKNIPF
ncbi:hypothetical protein RYX36_004629 [Vicia faba]